MAYEYRIKDQHAVYFITSTVHQWADVFTRKELLKKERIGLATQIWFREEGYHGEEIYSEEFFMTKFRYIHMNPVRTGIVLEEEQYLNSSCGDYYGTKIGTIVLGKL